jgi:hypothetical protein
VQLPATSAKRKPGVLIKLEAGGWKLEAGSSSALTCILLTTAIGSAQSASTDVIVRETPGGYPPMKVYDAQSIRNVAFVGHSGSGKTQLVSTLLFDAGAVNRLGRVDEGTTVTDYDEEEIVRFTCSRS